MAYFVPFHLSHFFNFTLPLPLCYSLNLTKKLWNERYDITWHYFRHCFSFSCFVFDLTLIRKSLRLNCYLFLHNFLTKITNSFLVTVIKQQIQKKLPYFLSIMSCSINKLKSDLLFNYYPASYSKTTLNIWPNMTASGNDWGIPFAKMLGICQWTGFNEFVNVHSNLQTFDMLPIVNRCSFYMEDAYEFLNEKLIIFL